MISLFFVAFIWIIVFILICYNWYQDDGVLFFLDLNRIGMMIWSLGTGLYDFALSDLYHPSLLINAVSLIVFVIFWFFASNSRKDVSLLKECFGELKIPNNIIYWFFLALIAILAFFAFKANADAGQLRGLSNNAGMKVDFKGGYFYRLSVPIAICFYLVGRMAKQKLAKIFSLLLFVAFLYFTACDLSRGPIVWILTGCLLFELLLYVKRTGKTKVSGKTFLLLVGVFVAVVFAFDYFGSIRTATLFSSVSSQYKMNVDVPDGFTWLYIYISSPLENARYALDNIVVKTPTFGAHLFYPFIKLFSNFLGFDLTDYEQLAKKATEAADRFHVISEQVKQTEQAMKTNAGLKAATVQYAKTRPVFEQYKATKYSRKFLAEHEADLELYRAAQAEMRSLLGGAKLPKMDVLKEEGRKLTAKKKQLYGEYQKARRDMQEIVTIKANIDTLMGYTEPGRKQEKER